MSMLLYPMKSSRAPTADELLLQLKSDLSVLLTADREAMLSMQERSMDRLKYRKLCPSAPQRRTIVLWCSPRDRSPLAQGASCDCNRFRGAPSTWVRLHTAAGVHHSSLLHGSSAIGSGGANAGPSRARRAIVPTARCKSLHTSSRNDLTTQGYPIEGDA
eukprot:4104731-Prymnesium_polylepis.3